MVPTLMHALVLSAGNEGDENKGVKHITLAKRLGRSERTIARHIATLEKCAPGFTVKRRRRSPTMSHPNIYEGPSAPKGAEHPGTMIYASLLMDPVFREATSAAQAILLKLQEGSRQFNRSWPEIAECVGFSVSTVRAAFHHFKGSGLLDWFQRRGKTQLSNRFTLYTDPDELLANLGDRIRAGGDFVAQVLQGAKARREARQEAMIAAVGPLLTNYDDNYPGAGWWREVETSIDADDAHRAGRVLRNLIDTWRAEWRSNWGRARPPPPLPARLRDLVAIAPELVSRRPEWATAGG